MPLRPIIFSIIACFIWGPIFIVPRFLGDFFCVDIALGRYFIYGLLSLSFFAFLKNGLGLLKAHWKKALVFSLVMNLGFYTVLALGVRCSSAAITALILGIAPLSIALASFFNEGGKLLEMVIPGLLIFWGLFFINMDAFSQPIDIKTFLIGLFFALLALAAWTWFVVQNSAYLRQRKDLKSREWTIIIGVMTLIVTLLAMTLRFFLIDKEYLHSFMDMRFLGLTGFMGVMCSFAGATLWNMGSRELPTSLSGQISVLETVFGLVFVYLLEARFPNALEFLGIVLILIGVMRGMAVFNQGEWACEKR